MKRVLLLGDYSAFHRYLKRGLVEKGCEVVLASDGDGWKKIGSADVRIINRKSGNGNAGAIRSFINAIVTPYGIVRQFTGYDVIQFINPKIFNYAFNVSLISKILKQNPNALISLVSVGYDYALLKAYRNKKLEYYIDDFETITPYSAAFPTAWFYRHCDNYLLQHCDVIIPGSFVYSLGYEHCDKVAPIVPMPVDLNEIQYCDNEVKDSVVFFHGLNREKEKGTKYIRAALEIIKKEYGSKVEVIIDGRMPFEKYINFINRANVIVDQCSGYGYGINALVSMAKGKVVVSGARSETLKGYNVNSCPIIPAKPDVEHLVNKFRDIVENKDKIPTIGRESRLYVEKYHDCVKIAEKYIKIWTERKKNASI